MDWQELYRLINHQWELKTLLSDKVCTPKINELLETGIRVGASAGKLLGAGGGGFILFLSEPERIDTIRKQFKDFVCFQPRIDFVGSTIIYFSHDDPDYRG
jgi:D-glycero-alpha-D-manno-heptose-7-phosphate kinase